MKLKNIKKALKSRTIENEGLMGMVTFYLMWVGWAYMNEKDGAWLLGLVLFSLGFFNCIPIALKLIDGKGLKINNNEEK